MTVYFCGSPRQAFAVACLVCLIFLQSYANENSRPLPGSQVQEPIHILSCANKKVLFASRATPLYMGQVQPTPGQSAGQAVIGTIIGVMLASKFTNRGVSDEAAFRKDLSNQFDRANVEKLISDGVRESLKKDARFNQAVWESVADAADMEQAGLLVNVKESKTLTVESNIQLDKDGSNLLLITKVNVWRKKSVSPTFNTIISRNLAADCI